MVKLRISYLEIAVELELERDWGAGALRKENNGEMARIETQGSTIR